MSLLCFEELHNQVLLLYLDTCIKNMEHIGSVNANNKIELYILYDIWNETTRRGQAIPTDDMFQSEMLVMFVDLKLVKDVWPSDKWKTCCAL